MPRRRLSGGRALRSCWGKGWISCSEGITAATKRASSKSASMTGQRCEHIQDTYTGSGAVLPNDVGGRKAALPVAMQVASVPEVKELVEMEVARRAKLEEMRAKAEPRQSMLSQYVKLADGKRQKSSGDSCLETARHCLERTRVCIGCDVPIRQRPVSSR